MTFINSNSCASSRGIVNVPDGEYVPSHEHDDVLFHRHCQATILSAYGIGGQGATWNLISELSSSLSNLPSNWINLFTRNGDNITQDLASILELIDGAYGQMDKDLTLTFKDIDGKLVGTGSMNLLSNPSLTFNFGRTVNLSIDGQPIIFHTLISDEAEQLDLSLGLSELSVYGSSNTTVPIGSIQVYSGNTGDQQITLPERPFTVTKNGKTLKSTNVFTRNDINIDVSHDYCKIPVNTTLVSTTNVMPEKNYRVYKVSQNGGSKTIGVQLTNYDRYGYGQTYMVEYEVHVTNTSSTTSLSITFTTNSESAGGEFTLTPLTDKLTVDPGKTNVYVHRLDRSVSSGKKHVYSLAYVY